jgi:hypothetical protein
MARKGWDSLSPAYRKRIAAAGMTREDYERGSSLAKARGHAHTPESPKRHDPQKFPKYEQQRQTIANDIVARKKEFFGKGPKWNPRKARRAVTESKANLEKLRYWASIDNLEDWLDAIRSDPEAAEALGYH